MEIATRRQSGGSISALSLGRAVVAALIAIALFAAMTMAVQQAFTRHGFGGADLVPIWQGGRALLFERISPYSPVVTLRDQEVILGGPAPAGSDQFAFAYPLITLLPALPILFLPFDLAQAAWLTASLALLVVGMLASAQAGSRWLVAAVPLAALAFYPSVRALSLGQVAPIVAGCFFVALVALRARADYAAGIALALTCIKPQMSFLLVPGLLCWAWRSGYPKAVMGFAVAMTAVAVASIVWWPGWMGEWIGRLVEYRAYAPQPGPLELVAGTWALAARVLLIAVGVYVCSKARTEAQLIRWLVPLTLLAAPNSSVSDQVILLLPAASVIGESNGRTAALLLGAGLVLPWIWFALSQVNGRESPAMVWFLPMVSFGIMLCTLVRARWQSRFQS